MSAPGVARLEATFDAAQADGRAALVIYLCAGDPSLDLSADLLVAAAEAGADVLEVGMPFSDPTADGETIQLASERALAAGASLPKVLDVVRQTRARTDVPIILFGYYNPILRYGEERLVRDAKDAGVDGLLVVDLPPEVASPLTDPLEAADLAYIPLVAPTSTDARIDAAGRAGRAFLYYVSMTGVTGGAAADLAGAAVRAKSIQDKTGRPVVVGFGVRTAEDVSTLAAHTAGVVVGSAVVRAVAAASDDEARIAAVRACVSGLAGGTSRA
ncbi:MAG: tryptophan synthase subunit alpha [Sandaracinaceae bacterium]